MPDEKCSAFAAELTELCRKHGLALANATVFVMEPEDHRLDYAIHTDGHLNFDAEFAESGRN